MTATNLHRHDNEFRKGAEFSRERWICAGEAKGEANGTVSGYNFEEDGESIEGVILGLIIGIDLLAFRDTDGEESEEDVPEIKGELFTEMDADVGAGGVRVGFFVGFRVQAEGLFFVDIGATDGDGDGEDGDVHHDQIGHLNGGMEFTNGDDRHAGSTGCSGLEDGVEDTKADGSVGDGRVVKVEENIKKNVGHVKEDENIEKDPSFTGWEEEGEAAAGVVEEKVEGFFDARVRRRDFVGYPNDKPKHARKPGVADDNEESHKD